MAWAAIILSMALTMVELAYSTFWGDGLRARWMSLWEAMAGNWRWEGGKRISAVALIGRAVRCTGNERVRALKVVCARRRGTGRVMFMTWAMVHWATFAHVGGGERILIWGGGVMGLWGGMGPWVRGVGGVLRGRGTWGWGGVGVWLERGYGDGGLARSAWRAVRRAWKVGRGRGEVWCRAAMWTWAWDEHVWQGVLAGWGLAVGAVRFFILRRDDSRILVIGFFEAVMRDLRKGG